MSRLFDGVNDFVAWSIGNCSLTGAWSFVQVIKLDAGVSWQGFLSNESSGSATISMGRHNSGVIATYSGGGTGTSTGVAISSSDGWALVGGSRPAGTTQTVTHHKGVIGGAWTHTAASGSRDNAAAQNGLVFGHINESDWFKGRLAVAAEFNVELSSAGFEALLTTFTRASWLATSGIVGLWDELDAFATDHTGGGATQTGLTGTTDDADDPAGWSSWAAAAPVHVPVQRFHKRRSGLLAPARFGR